MVQPMYGEDAYFVDKLEKLIEEIKKYNPAVNAARVREAFAYAQRMHGVQKRDSGEPFFAHPLEVAIILASLETDEETLLAALLHDCIEDTVASYDNIAAQFGKEVAQLVDGVTKLDAIEFISKDQQKAESFRKMFVAMARDLRVIIIKLADRLHNMRTLKYRAKEKRMATAQETLDIYAPLASRLGIYTIKWELEDLCLHTLNPQMYYDIMDKVAMKRQEREQAIEKILDKLKQRIIGELGINAQIDGRPKHFYSIYRKMQNHTFEQIYDLIAVRIVVPEIRDCYDVMGVVHQEWRPIAGRFKDYISVPKPNFYQSLHTTLVGEKGVPFEVQIRTAEMHRVAEYGVAAHWKYKEGANFRASAFDDKLSWMRQLLELQGEMNAREFIDTLREDMFNDEVFVFTPKGDIIDLPKGSTPLDFAYRIHSEVGNKCIGARVSQRIVPLDTELNMGDIVEIITSPSSKGPSMDWLKIVKTAQAKAKIRQWFKSVMRDDHIERGKASLEDEAARQGYALHKILDDKIIQEIMQKYGFQKEDDLYASVGFGGVSAIGVITRLVNELKKTQKPQILEISALETLPVAEPSYKGKSVDGVFVKGESGMLVRFAKCCRPVKGDDIVGYITRGRGVTIHRKDCSNLSGSSMEGQRLVEVSWDDQSPVTFNAAIQIVAYDRPGMLAHLTQMITNMQVPLLAISAKTSRNRTASVHLTLEIKNTEQLEKIMNHFQNHSDILEVFRVTE